jgi:transposase
MNTLNIERQTAVIAALVEGNSIRATVRMTGVAKDTVIKLLAKIEVLALILLVHEI